MKALDKNRLFWRLILSAMLTMASSTAEQPPTPKPPVSEPIEITELPLPPASPSSDAGACTPAINPNRTGCIDPAPMAIQSGSFLPDGRQVLVLVRFIAAPQPPDEASMYHGDQIILIKADGTKFQNGDPWKCVTCGVPVQNMAGASLAHDYPQAFLDGKRVLEGTNVIDCSPFVLTDDSCSAERVHIYPIRWNVRADGSGTGGNIRELRLHPDNVHLGFNGMSFENGQISQFGYIGRLRFDPKPKSGEPLVPRYELDSVTRLFKQGLDNQVLRIDTKQPGHLELNYQGITVGEFRGFSKNGREAFYIGYPFESSNIDLFAVDLITGHVRRLTSNPEYADPLDASPDDQWMVIEDTRGSGRQLFLAAMRGIPPLTDLLTTGAVSSVRNNGQRRFFQPILLDRFGDRGDYQGQQFNAGDGTPGSASDPNWNAMADPRWSPDGTRVVYWQALVTSPACGGSNPLPCPTSTEPGGRRSRVMVARLIRRKPLSINSPKPMADSVPWGTPYVAGSPTPHLALIPEGTYSLKGALSGSAKVSISYTADRRAIGTVAVSYENFSGSPGNIINGTESVTQERSQIPTMAVLNWHSDLVQTGSVHGTKVTSPGGFKLTIDVMTNIFQATGTLTTTIDGRTYAQPANGS